MLTVRERRDSCPCRRGEVTEMTLQWLWFVLVGVLLTGYAVLDGFDLGAGVLYPFIARTDAEKNLIRGSIGPVWDGNEVWLLTGGGALFAAFPAVYASTFSGFYLAIMLVLFGLILRAVSIEYRGRDEGFKKMWDAAFFVGSLLPALLVGVAVGNVIRGIPLDAHGDYTGTFFQLLNWYSLLIGLLGLCAIVTHGAAWLAMKLDGPVQERAIKVRGISQIVCVLLFVLATVATLSQASRATDNVFGALVRLAGRDRRARRGRAGVAGACSRATTAPRSWAPRSPSSGSAASSPSATTRTWCRPGARPRRRASRWPTRPPATALSPRCSSSRSSGSRS